MPLNLSILYRGDLSSCNYECGYCPFAKHWESAEELHADQQGLTRFCQWIESQSQHQFSILFTPWGEALVRAWYRSAIIKFSRLNHVRKVAVQTNLSCSLNWLRDTNPSKIGLWCTYHPTQTTRTEFLKQCQRLDELGVQYSVGCVGLREHTAEIQHLRRELRPQIYLWVNAFKSESEYYDEPLGEALTAIDPLFPINNTQHPSRGRKCHTGESVFTVDSLGDMRRCHFVNEVIGNIHQSDFEQALFPRTCPNQTCGCHIGYIHLEHLQLYPVYGEGLLERVPSTCRYGL